MIEARAVYEDGRIKRLLVTGHGGAPRGKDIVCSAVSAVTVGGLNALKHPEECTISIKEGYVNLEANRPLTEHDETVLETILAQLRSIHESAPEKVSMIVRKEG